MPTFGRWGDTIQYLDQNFPCPGLRQKLGAHIDTIVPAISKIKIYSELSLGSRPDAPDEPRYGTNTSKRQALRALLLCQRVYFSNIWAKRTQNRTEYVPDLDKLAPDWKTKSLNYWGNKSEMDIRDGIAMFAPVPNKIAADVSVAAKAGPPDKPAGEIAGNLFLRRHANSCIGADETCYRGVMAWLLQSGVTSLRYFMRDTAPNGELACDRLFGKGETVWDPNVHFKEDSNLPVIEAGFIVHMWTEQMGIAGWNGHWLISNGDGTICGVNNGHVNREDEQVGKPYTNNGKLRSQFEGYGGWIMAEDHVRRILVPREPKVVARGHLKKFDPMTLESRVLDAR